MDANKENTVFIGEQARERPGRVQREQEKQDWVARLYAGELPEDIATDAGVSRSTVLNRCGEHTAKAWRKRQRAKRLERVDAPTYRMQSTVKIETIAARIRDIFGDEYADALAKALTHTVT